MPTFQFNLPIQPMRKRVNTVTLPAALFIELKQHLDESILCGVYLT
jgi:hypothetical protein